MTDHAETVRQFWAAAEQRDWDSFARLLSPDVVYEAPQTRERVRGREAYTQFNREFPGDWHLTVEQVVADGDAAVARTDFRIGDDHMSGIHFFGFDPEGRVSRVTDYWPDPYEPSADRAYLVERY